MDERPTVEIVLPYSKAKVMLFEYLRNGDFRLIQRRLADTIKFKIEKPVEGEKPKVPEFSGGAAVLEQDYTLELLTQKILGKDGVEVKDVAGFYYNIRKEDGEVLYAKVNELTEGSYLSEERKKK